MVVINPAVVEKECKRREWNRLRLASEMGVSHQTVHNMFDGRNLLHTTQVALFNAFGGHIPFAELFVVTAGEIEPAEKAAVA